MRPRKIVLLYCSDERERSVLCCVLDTWMYRVIGGISKDGPRPDMALIIDDRSLATATMANTIAILHPDVQMLVLLHEERRVTPDGYPPRAQFAPLEMCSVADRMRMMVARKRGPKKQVACEQQAVA